MPGDSSSFTFNPDMQERPSPPQPDPGVDGSRLRMFGSDNHAGPLGGTATPRNLELSDARPPSSNPSLRL